MEDLPGVRNVLYLDFTNVNILFGTLFYKMLSLEETGQRGKRFVLIFTTPFESTVISKRKV